MQRIGNVGVPPRLPNLMDQTWRNGGEWGNLFALGAQQRQQAERRQQQRANDAQACEGCDGGLLNMRLHPRTIAQSRAAFKPPRGCSPTR